MTYNLRVSLFDILVGLVMSLLMIALIEFLPGGGHVDYPDWAVGISVWLGAAILIGNTAVSAFVRELLS